MTAITKTLIDLIAQPILQHLADTFSEKFKVAMIFLDHQGKPVTQPTPPQHPELADSRPLQAFIDSLLQTAPDPEKMGLQDGKAVYSGFFDGTIQRAVLPIVFQQRYLGVCQYVALQPNSKEELKKWVFVLEGFLYDRNSYLTYLDSRPHPPSEMMILICSRLQSQWQRLLEADRQRWIAEPAKEFEMDAEARVEESGLQGSLITTRSYDVIEADLPAVALLGYGSPEELIGSNFLSHLIRHRKQGAELVEFVENETPVERYDVELTRKNGSPLTVLLSIHPQKSFQNEPVGFQFLVTGKNSERLATKEQDSLADDSSQIPEEVSDTQPPIPSDLRLQLRDLFAKVKQLPDEKDSLVAQLPFPLFVLDHTNRVLVWNEAMQELVHIPSQAIVENNFDQLLLNQSHQLWHEVLGVFRMDPTQLEQTPPDTFALVDNEGNSVFIKVKLSKNRVLDLELVTVTVIDSNSNPPVSDVVVPEIKSKTDLTEYFAIGLAHAPSYSAGTNLLQIQESTEAIARNLDQAFLTVLGQNTWLSPLEQSGKKQRSSYLQIQRDIEHSFVLLRRLHYFAQSIPLHRRAVMLHSIIQQASSLQAQLFPQPVILHFDLSPMVGLVLADVSLLQQAIDFICRNAIEALQIQGDSLLVRTRPAFFPGDETNLPAIKIEIIDNGPGMDERILEKLYEPFMTTKQGERGYGLGLAAAYGIIRSHQGHLTIQTKKNIGTAVQIFIPALISAEEQAVAESLMLAFQPPKNVLIVEDDPDLISMMKTVLEKAGYKLSLTDTGDKAVAMMKKNHSQFDVAIIDLDLWGMTGLECAKQILQIKHMPIIISSGFPPVASVMDVVRASKGFYLLKPYGMSYLVDVVRQIA